ncbi:protein translocase subunit SecF [Candidatus Nanohalovita haloferacivicina]|uniref:protein translocase subunit SecF n=1 Tax=Candidatus Nanohalovita haloferacivicina TaxID=2978046 RepID=UPI00325FBB50|nr:Preprotein translocase subunit SecF [Candidatus Nanohalobia archaeon BNXNv]
MDLEKRFNNIYDDFDKYLKIPVAIILVALAILVANYAFTGEVVGKGLDFTGGTEVTYSVQGDFNTDDVESVFSEQGYSGVNALRLQTQSGNGSQLVVQIPPPSINDSDQAETIMQQGGYNATAESFSSISTAVSGQFFLQASIAFALAFMIMSLVIFAAFKDVVPSLAVIFAAAGDIIVALAGMALFNIQLTLGSFAALLMLIGYSVDTDIVLSTRVLKRERKSLRKRMWSSVKTGVTMSSGGIAGFTLLFIVSYLIVGPSELSNIAAVMLIGLLADMPLTWFGNAIILKKYVDGDFDNLEEMIKWK